MEKSATAPKREELNDPRTHKIIGCAITVHKAMGPGNRESVYEECMGRELRKQCIEFTRQTRLTVSYDGDPVGKGFRPDFLVERSVILELKAVEVLHPVHVAQVLAYMRHSGIKIGLIINFNVDVLVHGVKRLILTKSG